MFGNSRFLNKVLNRVRYGSVDKTAAFAKDFTLVEFVDEQLIFENMEMSESISEISLGCKVKNFESYKRIVKQLYHRQHLYTFYYCICYWKKVS